VLKLIGFFINIFASIYLIHGILFRGPNNPSVTDFLKGRTETTLLEHISKRSKGTTLNDLGYLNNTGLIASAFVIIGSSLQMTGDLLDP
jgi:hypothetical protein